jgi:hypothetical protein
MAERLLISDQLQDCAKKYRDEYIDYIGSLSLEYDNPLWYLTSLSEKNPWVSEFFLHFCYVKSALDCIDEKPQNQIIVCESRSVFLALRDNLKNYRRDEIAFHEAGSLHITSPVSLSLQRIKSKLWFLFRYVSRVIAADFFSLLAHRPRPESTSDRVVIMHSWADSRSFARKNDYHEIYLGGLGKDLEHETGRLIYLVDVLPTIWYPKALYALLRVQKNICLMEEFLSVTDIIKSLWYVLRYYPSIPKAVVLGDVNVRTLISHDFMLDKISSRMEQVYLNFFISQKMSLIFPECSFLYSFENHIWEKAFCAGFKRTLGVKTIGYAIIFVNRMYTCFSVSSQGNEKEWLPDRILVSGWQGKNMLTESGFDPEKIVVGGAIRYPDIHCGGKFRKTTAKKVVLLALSGSVGESLELVDTSLVAFSDMDDLTVLIKCHPTVPFGLLTRYLSDLPNHFQVADSPIDALLEGADLVLYTESTVCVEALARGIPVIHVGSNFTIDINIFEGLEIVPSATSPLQIRLLAEKMLKSGTVSRELSEEIIGQLLAPVDQVIILSIILDREES